MSSSDDQENTNDLSAVVEASIVDLDRLVKRLRSLQIKRVRIPKHSGKASSEQRRRNRRERRELSTEIEATERAIIRWALVFIDDLTHPDPFQEIRGDVEEAEEEQK